MKHVRARPCGPRLVTPEWVWVMISQQKTWVLTNLPTISHA